MTSPPFLIRKIDFNVALIPLVGKDGPEIPKINGTGTTEIIFFSLRMELKMGPNQEFQI